MQRVKLSYKLKKVTNTNFEQLLLSNKNKVLWYLSQDLLVLDYANVFYREKNCKFYSRKFRCAVCKNIYTRYIFLYRWILSSADITYGKYILWKLQQM